MYICLLLKHIIELLQNQKAHDIQAWIAHVTEKQLTSLTPEASWKLVLRTVGGGGEEQDYKLLKKWVKDMNRRFTEKEID